MLICTIDVMNKIIIQNYWFHIITIENDFLKFSFDSFFDADSNSEISLSRSPIVLSNKISVLDMP